MTLHDRTNKKLSYPILETTMMIYRQNGGRDRNQFAPPSQIEVKIKISLNQTLPIYQMLAPKMKELKALGMSYREIS